MTSPETFITYPRSEEHRFDPTIEQSIVKAAEKTLGDYGFDFEHNTDVSTDNPTLLFTISGGVKYEDVLSGHQIPPDHARQASIQRCVRADGFAKIGHSGRHHIAFDMLGHFSFFESDALEAKTLAIQSAISFLNEIGVEDIFARHHPDDVISGELLKDQPIDVFADDANTHVCNRQLRSGYRVELGRVIDGTPTELWNIVFTEFEGTGQDRQPLTKIAFDSGASLDRLAAASMGQRVNYHTPTWQKAQRNISAEPAIAARLADFTKAAAVICESNIGPGPKGAQYIARKVFSELVYQKIENPSFDMPRIIADAVEAHDLTVEPATVIALFEQEWQRIGKAIQQGTKVIMKNMIRDNRYPGETEYTLYKQSYGLDRETVDLIIRIESNT